MGIKRILLTLVPLVSYPTLFLGASSSTQLFTNAGTCFAPPVAYPTAPQPLFVAVADVNGDGKVDLVTSNAEGANSVSVLLGNGDGTFGTKTDYPAGPTPAKFAVADFNGDGKVDLAVADAGARVDGRLSILLGNGDGSFQAPVSYKTGRAGATEPGSVAVGDFNQDGKLDIAVSDIMSGINIFLGNGDGTFQPRIFTSGPQQPLDIETGDFNGDGKLDLVFGVESITTGILGVELGNGDGTFAPEVDYRVPANPGDFKISDLNSDGNLDLVMASGFDVTILFGRGDGTFAKAVNYPAGDAVAGIAFGDFTGDQISDVVVALANHRGLLLYSGKGDGSFLPPGHFIAAGFATGGPTAADFNRDGKLDFVSIGSAEFEALVFLNAGNCN